MSVEINADGYIVPVTGPDTDTLLDSLLENLPGYSLITVQMKRDALKTALVPDAQGLWPGQPGYANTYDAYHAALSMIGFLQAQPVLRQSSSEGTSVSVDAPNWGSLIAYYRSLSPIAQAISSGPLLTPVAIPGAPHVRRTNMRGGYGNDNVDTDLS